MRRITTNIFNSRMRLVRQHLYGFINLRPPLIVLTIFSHKVIVHKPALFHLQTKDSIAHAYVHSWSPNMETEIMYLLAVAIICYALLSALVLIHSMLAWPTFSTIGSFGIPAKMSVCGLIMIIHSPWNSYIICTTLQQNNQFWLIYFVQYRFNATSHSQVTCSGI